MIMQRREFLTKTSLVLGSSLLSLPPVLQASSALSAGAAELKAADWPGLRRLAVEDGRLVVVVVRVAPRGGAYG